MQCPRCNGQMTTQPINEHTSKRMCGSCGHSEIVETKDARSAPGRRLLTDDMPTPGNPLNG